MEGSNGFLGSGAGSKVIVVFVIGSGGVEGTRIMCGGWTATSLSTSLTTQVISERSSSDNAVKMRRAWDCRFISSRRLCDWWIRLWGSKVTGHSSEWQRASFAIVVSVGQGEEGSGGVRSGDCVSSLMTRFVSLDASNNGHCCCILSHLAVIAASSDL